MAAKDYAKPPVKAKVKEPLPKNGRRESGRTVAGKRKGK